MLTYLSFKVVNTRAFLLSTGIRKYRWNSLKSEKLQVLILTV